MGIFRDRNMNEELQYSETGSLLDELKAAAFEYLLLNPGSEFGDWKQGLISDYPTEVVDALGNNPEEVYADLADLWESDYADPKTGIEQKYSEWAMSFANEYAVGIYYFLVEECAKSGDVPLSSANRQVTHNKPIDCAAQSELNLSVAVIDRVVIDIKAVNHAGYNLAVLD